MATSVQPAARGPAPVDYARRAAAPRAHVVLLFGAPVCVCFAPLLATGVSNYRRLAAYERELGRDITNG